MISLRVFMDAESMGADVPREKIVVADKTMRIGVLPGGMASGKPSVELLIELGDGSVVFAETSLILLQTAVRAFTARYGDLTMGAEPTDPAAVN